MTPSEHTNLLDRRVNSGTEDSPSARSAPAKKSFLVGLLGVLVGAALVVFSVPHQQSQYSLESDTYFSNLPLMKKKHHHDDDHHKHHDHKDLQKEVVDEGNWIKAFGVSRGVLVEIPLPPTTLYASGQTAFNGTDLVGDDMGGQLAAAIANVDQTLEMAGMTKCDIVKLYVFVTSTDDVLSEWDQYETWLADCPVKPANTLVAIASLFPPDALIEIDVTAVH